MSRARLVFLALAILVAVQMLWWAYLVTQQQSEIASLINKPEAFEKSRSYQNMILLESIFFLFAWGLGIGYVYRSMKKERKVQEERRTFLSLVTHELKTPLANIQLALETLKRPALNEEQKQTYLRRALTGTEKLKKQIEQILSFNEIEKKTSKQAVSLKSIVENIISDLAITDKIHHLDLKEAWVEANPDEAEAIVRNILSNSLKYSSHEQEAQIEVHLKKTNKTCLFVVKDNGIGMSKEELENATKPFWRAEFAKQKAISGSGLGLSLCRELCRKNNARLKISSEGANLGCTFEVEWLRKRS